MEALINKNISEIDRIERSSNHHHHHHRRRRISKSIFCQLTDWLPLIKGWQDDSPREVCKHVRQCSFW